MSANNYQINENVNAPAMPEHLYKEAIKLFSIPSTLYNEKSISFYICNILDNLNLDYSIDDYGNIIVTKGTGLLSCFCSHLDTVHLYKNGFNLMYQKEKNRTYLFACDNNKKSVGIGGDDKCGIFVCLYLLKTIDNIKVIFFSQEESGGIGSSNIDLKIFDDCKFLASVDRWNGHDFINKYSGQNTISKQFKKDIASLLTKYDYSFNTGMFTDCFNVMERGLEISCFNLSCGYYSHHSDNEYVDLNELYNSCLLCEELSELSGKYDQPYKKIKYSIRNDWDFKDWNKKKFDYKTPEYDAKNFNENDPSCENCGLELLYYENKYCSSCKSYMTNDDDFDNLRSYYPKY